MHSWRIHSYRGIGRIPRNLYGVPDPTKRLLLDHLPRLLRGYGRSLGSCQAVLVIVDLDDRDCLSFKQQLLNVLQACYPRPQTVFRIAIEEIEAWHLLPLFIDYSNLDGYQACLAWLRVRRSVSIHTSLRSWRTGFLVAMFRLETVFPEEELRDQFIQRVAAMVVYFVQNPLVRVDSGDIWSRKYAEWTGSNLRLFDRNPPGKYGTDRLSRGAMAPLP